MARYVEVDTASIGGGHRLRKDAAVQFLLLAAAFYAEFGYALPVRSAWRSFARQDYLWNGWLHRLPGFNLALPPGESTHNWGLGVDFGGRAGIEGTREHAWLVKHAPAYGFHWTGRNFSQREAWHFDYKPHTATVTSTPTTPDTEEEEDDMPRNNAGFHWEPKKGVQRNIIANSESGFFHEFDSDDGDFNTRMSRQFGITEDWPKISESERNKLADDHAKVRARKA